MTTTIRVVAGPMDFVLRSFAPMLLVVLAAIQLGCSSPSKAPDASAPTVLRGARLIDGSGTKPVENSVVVIRDGRIVAAGPSGSTSVPAGAREVNYSGKTIIPGLISDHSHVGIIDGMTVVQNNYNRDNVLRQLRQYEAYGVTTVTALGLNGPPFVSIRADMHAGRVRGADLFGAPQGIGVPDGAPPAKMLPLPPDQLYRPVTPEAAREAVRAMVAQKPDFIKLWLDDFGGSLPVRMKPEIYQAVIDEAHKNGVRVAAHIHDLNDAKAVVRAGTDVVAHGVRDRPVDDEFIALMKSRGVWYIATIQLDEATYIYPERLAWTQTTFVLNAMQPALRAQFDDAGWRATTAAEPRMAAAKKDVQMNQRNLKTLYDAGVKIGFGTDSGATPWRIPGVAEHRELALMVDAGLTPVQAISVATSNAAQLLAVNDRGTLTSGKWADLVVLDADPSADVWSTTRIVAVWHRGVEAAGPVTAFKP